MERVIRSIFAAACVFFAAVSLAAADPLAACAVDARSVDAGPFAVEGPKGSYRYEDSRLVVSGEGVTVVGMNGEGYSDGNSIRVENGVSKLTFGSGVAVATLTDEGSTALWLEGGGNSIAELDNARGIDIKGPGSLTVGRCADQIDVSEATVTLVSEMVGAIVWQGGTLVLEPGSRAAFLMVHGGTLDLSRVGSGPKPLFEDCTIGKGSDPTSLIVPFGTESIDDLMGAVNRFVGGTVDVRSDGELVGVLKDDGTIYYTATRTVTFTGFDGAVLKTESVRLFQSAEAPDVPEQQGFRFAGWDRGFERVTQDMIVAAVFEPVGDGSPDEAPVPLPVDPPAGKPAAAALPAVGDAVDLRPAIALVAVALIGIVLRARRAMRAG